MNGILLTQNSTFIIGQVAWLLGKIMEGIFEVLNMIGIPISVLQSSFLQLLLTC